MKTLNLYHKRLIWSSTARTKQISESIFLSAFCSPICFYTGSWYIIKQDQIHIEWINYNCGY